ALLDRLLVADVGVDGVEGRKLGARLDREVQAALGHKREQADRLQADRLSARVRAGDDHGVSLLVEHEVDRHHRRRVEQRVPRLAQAKYRTRMSANTGDRGWEIGEWMEHRLGGPKGVG